MNDDRLMMKKVEAARGYINGVSMNQETAEALAFEAFMSIFHPDIYKDRGTIQKLRQSRRDKKAEDATRHPKGKAVMTTKTKATPQPEGVTERQAGVAREAICWARLEDMRLCGKPAIYINVRLGATVCQDHINA